MSRLQRSSSAFYREVCARHPWAAVDNGKTLQFYEKYKCDVAVSRGIHLRLKQMQSWSDGEQWARQRAELAGLESRVAHRVRRHGKQCEIATKGVLHRDLAFLLHLYKFDETPLFTGEIIVPDSTRSLCRSNLEVATEALLCLEAVMPPDARCHFPSSFHDMDFMLVSQFIEQ